jgi:ABC-type nitrate/sulfonate/bicarbonate transport system permease component
VKETLLNLIQPFRRVSRNVVFLLFALQAAFAILIWSLSGSGLIPGPFKVMAGVIRIVSAPEFGDNLFSSLLLTTQGMFFSIAIALVIAYLYLIPFFKPVVAFITKCRYLTLTGLIFLFTLLSKNGHSLKINLLIFGIVPFFVTSLVSIIDSINMQEYELCKTLKMSDWRALLEVVVIGRLDQVFEVMRQNFAISWMMITMVEGLNMSEGGLGTMLIKSNKYIDLSTVFGILVIIFSLGIIWDYFLAVIRLWLFPYTKIEMLK